MATSNAPVRAKRRAAPSRESAVRPVSKQPRKKIGKGTEDRQATAGVRHAAAQKLIRLRENLSDSPLKSVVIGATAAVLVAGVGLFLGRLWLRR